MGLQYVGRKGHSIRKGAKGQSEEYIPREVSKQRDSQSLR